MTNNTTPHPYRAGLCDGYAGRDCKSPFPAGWGWAHRTAQYVLGYMDAEARREQMIKDGKGDPAGLFTPRGQP